MLNIAKLIGWSIVCSMLLLFELLGVYFFALSYMANMEFALPASVVWILAGGIMLKVAFGRLFKAFRKWSKYGNDSLVIDILNQLYINRNRNITFFIVDHPVIHALALNKKNKNVTPIYISSGKTINISDSSYVLNNIYTNQGLIQFIKNGYPSCVIQKPLWIQYDEPQSLKCFVEYTEAKSKNLQDFTRFLFIRGYKIHNKINGLVL